MKSQFIYSDGSPIGLLDKVITSSGRLGKTSAFDIFNERPMVEVFIKDADGEAHHLWYSPNALKKHVNHSVKVNCLCQNEK
jgi:hypothetical protein